MAYLGFHFGGGFKIFLEKWGYLDGAKRHAAGGEATRLLWGFGGMLPRENFKKWCNLVRFREYFATILSKNNLKKVIFYIKITDNVLLRTFFRGIAAYSPDFLSLVQFGVFWSTVSVNFLLRKYYNYLNNIDMALLRTSYLYGGFLEYYIRLQFSAFWSMHDKTLSSENANFKMYPSPKN